MAIDPGVLARQRAVLSGEEKPRRPEQTAEVRSGPPLTSAVCPRCQGRRLAITNRSGVCAECWDGLSRKQRVAISGGRPTRVAKATQRTIERARARLEANGIHVEAA